MKFEEKYVKVGERGQIVIPKKIREREGIRPMHFVKVIDMPGQIVIKKVTSGEPEKRFFELLGKTGLSSKDWGRIHRLREER